MPSRTLSEVESGEPKPSSSVTSGPTATTTGPSILTPTADFIYMGGPILTMDEALPAAEAVGVADDLIVAVGSETDVFRHATQDTQVIDLAGAALMPGFVDAHSHFFERPDSAGTDLEGISGFVLQNGITTTAEFAVAPELLRSLEELNANGALGVRLSAYLLANDACGNPIDDWWLDHPPTRQQGELLRIGGVKIYADGGACNTPAVSFEYLNGIGQGDLYFSSDDLALLLTRVQDAGHQAAVHALGDRAIETVLDAYEQVIDPANPIRHRLEHSAATRPDLRTRHSKVGVVTTVFGAFQACFYSGQLGGFSSRTPEEFLEWEWPWDDLLEANPTGRFAWHADFPAFDPYAVRHLAGFVTRGQVHPAGSAYCEPQPSMADHVITVDQALQLMTTGAAYALGREQEVGSLAAGKYADLVVLSADPHEVPERELHDLQTLVTIIGGRVGWCAPGANDLCPKEVGPQPAASPTAPAVPSATPTPISGTNILLRSSATASAKLADSPAAAAVDGDADTAWNSGGGPPQWLSVDLGSERQVRRVRLTVAQSPSGSTDHRLLATDSEGGTARLLYEAKGMTADRDMIDVTFDESQSVRYLRIETHRSPSWVAWYEIEAYE